MVLKAKPTTGVLLAPCYNEFRGPLSNYVKQVALASTTYEIRVEEQKHTIQTEEYRHLLQMMIPAYNRRGALLSIRDGNLLQAKELGFNTNLKINLSDLTSVLEEVICNVLKRPVLQLAFVSYQNELQYLRQTVDQMQRERNKLRVNIEEANSRAALLAQEVDDNHAKLENSLHKKLLLMEKKYQEQARELVEELQQERDSLNSQTSKLKQQLQKDMDEVREEEVKLKSRLSLLEQENSRLEQELHEVSEKYLEAEKLNEILQKELLIMPDLKQKLADLESHLNEVQEQNHLNLLQELEKCKKSNQELQDKIDELTLEIENMHQSSAADLTPSKAVNRTHSWLSDYKKAFVAGYKRRGSESSSEENSDEESPTIGKLRRTFLSNGKDKNEIDSPTFPPEIKKSFALKNNQPSMVDILLKDMMHDQSRLLRKLQIAEESRLKIEKAYKQSENKNKILSGLVRNMSGAVTA
ncbi:ninein-like protein [Trichonephila clavipes]|uniref:Ninein-like protein n=1 Tax=Trichonephila clavipes TaxID=2585209 RepID=A0A8X6WFN4_TRICX|nr:ninein-like protein [Trichonephila clavipes]